MREWWEPNGRDSNPAGPAPPGAPPHPCVTTGSELVHTGVIKLKVGGRCGRCLRACRYTQWVRAPASSRPGHIPLGPGGLVLPLSAPSPPARVGGGKGESLVLAVCRPSFMQIRPLFTPDPIPVYSIPPLFMQTISLFADPFPVYLTPTLFNSIPTLFIQAPFLSAEALARLQSSNCRALAAQRPSFRLPGWLRPS